MALGRNSLWRSALFLAACMLVLASRLPQSGTIRGHAEISESQPGSFAGSRPAGCTQVMPPKGFKTGSMPLRPGEGSAWQTACIPDPC